MMSEQADNPPEVHVVREKSGPVRSVFCMHRNVQPFRELCRSVPIAGPVKQIFGERRLHLPQQAELQGVIRGHRVALAPGLRLLAL